MTRDIRTLLATAAARPHRSVDFQHLRARAHRSRLLRAAGLATAGIVLTVTTYVVGGSLISSDRPLDPATPDRSASPSERGNGRIEWPAPFVPPTSNEGGRTIMPVLFTGRTAAVLSYPSRLHLAERGVQTTASYSFKEGRPNEPHDILFVHGALPDGLVGEPLETFPARPSEATLHRVLATQPVARGGLRGRPEYALLLRLPRWFMIVTLHSREDAGTVVDNLHPSVTRDGWPSLFASGPLVLSEGFGEARGPHLEFNDDDPTIDVHTESTYVVMGPIDGCSQAEDGVGELGKRTTYGAKCLAFEGNELGIFVSIYGPERFVRALYEGLELANPADAQAATPRCGRTNIAGDEYGTEIHPVSGPPGTQVAFSGTTLRGEDWRWAPSDRMEAWWNTETPGGPSLEEGPVMLLARIDDMERCRFETTFEVPDVEPGRYTISVFAWEEDPSDGYGFFLPHRFTVTDE